jgi:hypothetical protein
MPWREREREKNRKKKKGEISTATAPIAFSFFMCVCVSAQNTQMCVRLIEERKERQRMGTTTKKRELDEVELSRMRVET